MEKEDSCSKKRHCLNNDKEVKHQKFSKRAKGKKLFFNEVVNTQEIIECRPTDDNKVNDSVSSSDYGNELEVSSSSKEDRGKNSSHFIQSQELSFGNRQTHHNTSEKKRRIALKKRFDELRQSIPSFTKKGKVPTLSILKDAKVLIDELFKEEARLLCEKDDLLRKNNLLMKEANLLEKLNALES